MLCKHGDIGLLSLVRHKADLDTDWPSWVPRLYRDWYVNNHYCKWNASANQSANASKIDMSGRHCMNIRVLIRVGVIEKCYKPRDVDDMQNLLRFLGEQHGADVVAWTVMHGNSLKGYVKHDFSTDFSRQRAVFEAYLAGPYTGHAQTAPVSLALARNVQALRARI